MPSIGSILSIANTGLRTQQLAMNTAAHNIANASTEGYSRQRVVMSGNPALRTEDGVFGTGVGVRDVQRVRDSFLDGTFHREAGQAARHESRSDMLQRVEAVLGEPSEVGLAAALDQFFSAWSDLATNPTSTTTRSVVRQRGIQLADKFRELSNNVDLVRQEVEERLSVAVSHASALGENVANISRQIVSTEANGTTAGDLRDRRGRALDELAGLVPVKITERDNGSVGVASSGINIVDGAQSVTLEVRSSGGVWGLAVQGRPGLMTDVGGSVGGLLDVINTDLPAAQQTLDDLAGALVSEVNSVHATGTNPNGTTGISFFDASATTASSMDVSTEIRTGASNVAAGTPDALGTYRAGANDVALTLASLRNSSVGSLGTTMSEHFQGLVSDIGLAVRSSTDAAEVHRALADQADVRRQSSSGVSLDEELVQMIQFQSAYQAAARVVTTVDEMLQSLLAI